MKLLGEAARSAVAQPVASAVIALLVAGACGAILATTGQTVRAEQDVLARIDDAGTRSIVISDINGTAGLTSAAVDRLNNLEGVEWAIGLGPARDVRTVGNPGGSPAAIRSIYGAIPPQVDLAASPQPDAVLVGPQAQETLGMLTPYGGVAGETDMAVIGGFTAQDPLSFLNRGLLRLTDTIEQVRSIHLLAAEPSKVGAVRDAALPLVGPEDITSVGIETSETLADVRAAVQGELGRFGRSIVGLVLAAGIVLISLAVYAAVTARRRDFGRRRALGASRGDILTLVSAQTALAAITGALLGTVVSWPILTATTGVAPDLRFSVATGVLTVIGALLASLPPALGAAYRDPVSVLRVP